MKVIGFLKSLFTIIIIGAGFYGGAVVFNTFIWEKINPDPSIEEQFAKEVSKISNIEHFEDNVSLNSKEPFAMLLLGLDDDNFNSGRSDTIMVALVNPEKSKISLVSIPRDLRVKLPGGERYDKINAAFARGGIDLAAKTVEDTFSLPLEYYATINFKGFEEMVNAIGGIKLRVEKDLTFSDRITKTRFTLNEGDQKLNGIQALNYARFRGDSEGDFGRMRRQQQVIKAIVDQTMTFRNIPKMISIIEVVDDNFRSNVSFKDLGLLALKMRNVDSSQIETIQLKGKPAMINGISYVQSSEEDINEVVAQIHNFLKGN